MAGFLTDSLFSTSSAPSAPLCVGVDEAGRGPLAGPVVAAAVLLPIAGIAGLADSKQLSAPRRAALESKIKRTALWAIASATVAEIDEINILQASLLAMARAVARLEVKASLASQTIAGARGFADSVEVLVDGNRLPHWNYRARAIIKGDQTEPCISAASILAKQARDRLMCAAASRYAGYGWARNKGYGTAAHLEALDRLGTSPFHRHSFAPVRQRLNHNLADDYTTTLQTQRR